jgi:hypothetical protein
MYTTDLYEGVLAETVTITSVNGNAINAYIARPLGEGKFPAMMLAHHMPGWARGTARPPTNSRSTAMSPSRPTCTSARGMARPKMWRRKSCGWRLEALWRS